MTPFIAIAPELKAASEGMLVLGVVGAQVRVVQHSPELWTRLEEASADAARQLRLDTLPSIPEIAGLRRTYKALGKEPQKYRGSNEALLRRVLKGQGLYKINNVVDVNNLVSITTRRSVGCYDLAMLGSGLSFRIGEAGEHYKGIGKGDINIEGLPVFVDAAGPFGSPTADSERACIRGDTTELMLIIISFDGEESLREQANAAAETLTRYCSAKDAEVAIID